MSKLKAQMSKLKLKTKNIRDFKNARERRKFLEEKLNVKLSNIGSFTVDENTAGARNCENMIGAAQIPIGIAGPLILQTSNCKLQKYFIPLSTTEGALVASVNRGCKAITLSGGALTDVENVGAPRGPVFKISETSEIKSCGAGSGSARKFRNWLIDNFDKLKKTAESTSSHLKLLKFDFASTGRHVFIRFYFDTQDAMGMNMATIAAASIIRFIEVETGIKCISVSGNFCTDKKASHLNFNSGRGKRVWAESIIKKEIVKKVLKTTPQKIYEVWLAKCMIGSAMSGSMGFNAQHANIVAAIFIAAGQDPAHVVEGSLGETATEILSNGDLYVSCYLPSLMVGTVGGGTSLATQKEALQILGVFGGNKGKNALQFAQIVGAAVLAGEISLLASLAEGSLAAAHKKLGRGKF